MAMTLRADKGAILSWNEMDANFKACLGIHNLLHVQDQKPSGTGGGTFTSGAWRTRDLNTILTNNIVGSSLIGNQITLPAGEYWSDVSSVACAVAYDVLSLRTISPSISELVLSSLNYASIASNTQTNTSMSGKFSLFEVSILELQHRCNTSNATYGLGIGNVSIGQSYNIFSDLKIWKLS